MIKRNNQGYAMEVVTSDCGQSDMGLGNKQVALVVKIPRRGTVVLEYEELRWAYNEMRKFVDML